MEFSHSNASELALASGDLIADPKQRSNVVDLYPKRVGTEKEYIIPALFIAEMATWGIPKNNIPIHPKAVSEWEIAGQGMQYCLAFYA